MMCSNQPHWNSKQEGSCGTYYITQLSIPTPTQCWAIKIPASLLKAFTGLRNFLLWFGGWAYVTDEIKNIFHYKSLWCSSLFNICGVGRTLLTHSPWLISCPLPCPLHPCAPLLTYLRTSGASPQRLLSTTQQEGIKMNASWKCLLLKQLLANEITQATQWGSFWYEMHITLLSYYILTESRLFPMARNSYNHQARNGSRISVGEFSNLQFSD